MGKYPALFVPVAYKYVAIHALYNNMTNCMAIAWQLHVQYDCIFKKCLIQILCLLQQLGVQAWCMQATMHSMCAMQSAIVWGSCLP